MADVLETLTVPRASVLPAASLSPVVSRISGRRNVVNLPESRGLKIQSLGTSVSVNLGSTIDRRGARIVCETQVAVQVEQLIEEICVKKLLPLPDAAARNCLSKIDEESAIDVLKRISSTYNRIYNLNGYIMYMTNKYGRYVGDHGESVHSSPSQYPPTPSSSSSSPSCSSVSSTPTTKSTFYDSPTLKQFIGSACSSRTGVQRQSSPFSCSSLKAAIPSYGLNDSYNVSPRVRQFHTSPSSCSNATIPNHVDQHFSGLANTSQCGSPTPNYSSSMGNYKISQQSLVLSELEFRKLFMVHSYIGSCKLEDAISVEEAIEIKSMKTVSMLDFEDWMWSKYGSRYCQHSERVMYLDWDSGKTHLYICCVSSDGGYQFKGPYLDSKKTHLQRAIGDENVLIVKFAEAVDIMTNRIYEKIAEAGILIGSRRYRFFVFKDGGKDRQKDGTVEKERGAVKCYFVKRESIAPSNDRDSFLMNYKTIHDVRCLFMHVHMVPNMAKYIARFSLILSTTIKLQIDLTSVSIEEIDDIHCIDEKGCIVHDQDGEPLIQTDGTGFISEDIALLVPNNFYDAKYMNDKDYKMFDSNHLHIESATTIKEAPLLIQCRLYKDGYAVKGTLLVNKKLKPKTIQIRPSMIKVKKDPRLADRKSFNSLEVVSVSHKPKAAKLSKYLIALLSIGGVPQDYFLGLLKNTVQDAQRVSVDPRAAFRVAQIYQHIDDSGICLEMLGACIPPSEPFLQYRLSQLGKEERKGLGEGKLPISESFYLIGTTDPTGTLNSDEVCVILESGQISGKVLVYRNPGLHFGDIHVLNARYVKNLEGYIGNSKYAIFFSTKGRRSVASEIANGDFDGDLYWVSRNPQLLHYFKASEPWERSYSTPSPSHKKPSDFSSEELEQELLKLIFTSNSHSSIAGTAADSWLAFMDRYLTLQDDDADAKYIIKNKMLNLTDLYYDALDASKSGKKVVIPNGLKATHYPHYMGRKPEYHSTSVLGVIYDEFQGCKNDKLPVQEIWKLPYFITRIPDSCLTLWKERYQAYRQEMSNALKLNDLSKNDAANSVISKYKQMLYGASDFKDSTREIEHLYNEALAIYHVSYDYAKTRKDNAKCGFAWKVAGSALCAYHRKVHCMKTGEREITILSSSLDGIF